MDAITASRLLPNPFTPQFSLKHRSSSLPPLASGRPIRIQIFASKSPKFHRCFFPVGFSFGAFSSVEAHRTARSVEEDEPVAKIVNCSESEGKMLKFIAKQTLLTLFCFAIGFAPIRALRVSAQAAPVATEKVLDKKQNGKEKKLNSKGHEYSEFTQRLLVTVSGLITSVEEVRKGNGDLKQVDKALKAVKEKKGELQDEIMSGLYSEMRELKREKEKLIKRSEGIVDKVVKTKKEYEKFLGNAGEEEGKDRVEKLEESLRALEEEYNWIWERVGQIEDRILRTETVALSFGVRELCFIERECMQLVENFSRELRRKDIDRYER